MADRCLVGTDTGGAAQGSKRRAIVVTGEDGGAAERMKGPQAFPTWVVPSRPCGTATEGLYATPIRKAVGPSDLFRDGLDMIFDALSMCEKLTAVEHTCRAWRAASLAGAGWARLYSDDVDHVVEEHYTTRGRVVALLGVRLSCLRRLHWRVESASAAAELVPLVAVRARPRHVKLSGDVLGSLRKLRGTGVLTRLETLSLHGLSTDGRDHAGHQPLRLGLLVCLGATAPTLHTLALFGNHLISGTVVAAIAACPRLHTLTAWTGGQSQTLSTHDCAALATSTSLTDLSLGGFNITPGAFALLAPPNLRRLGLSLAFCEPGGATDSAAVAGTAPTAPQFAHLTSVMWNCDSLLADKALTAFLAGHAALEKLRVNSATGATADESSAAAWENAFDARHFPRLSLLHVFTVNPVVRKPLLALARARLSQLTSLTVHDSRADSRVAADLLAAFAPRAAVAGSIPSANGSGDGASPSEGTTVARSADASSANHARGLDDTVEPQEAPPSLDHTGTARHLKFLKLIGPVGADVLQIVRDIAPYHLREFTCLPLDPFTRCALEEALPRATITFLQN